MSGKTATIAQVAELAGVSVPTVSKVLNRRSGVSQSTRSAVEQILESTGYERRGRNGVPGTGIIDMLIAGMDSQWALTLLQGACEQAQQFGLDVVTNAGIETAEAEANWLDRVLRRGSSGVIVVVSKLSDHAMSILRREHLPIVLVDPSGDTLPDVAAVAATNFAGGRSATEHLIGLGHSRIGIITGPGWEACHLDRLDGYSAALRRAGLPLDPALIRHGDSLESGGQQLGAVLLDLPDPPTAIFSCSDEQAYGVYKAARERGLKIPRDLSVVGFDDVSLCQWVTPQLTTVRQPLKDMGAAAVRTIANLASDQVQPTRYEMATQLVVRASTAKPRKAKLS